MFALPAFLGGWRLWFAIGLAVVVAAIGGYVLWLRSEIGALEQAKAQLQADKGRLEAGLATAMGAAADNARELEAATVRHEADMRAVERYYTDILTAVAAENEAKEEAFHAPDSDDGPVSPVLRRALDRLRGAPGAAGPGGGDEAAGGAGEGARRLSPLPFTPPPARRWNAAGRGDLPHRAGRGGAELPRGAGPGEGVERGGWTLKSSIRFNLTTCANLQSRRFLCGSYASAAVPLIFATTNEAAKSYVRFKEFAELRKPGKSLNGFTRNADLGNPLDPGPHPGPHPGLRRFIFAAYASVEKMKRLRQRDDAPPAGARTQLARTGCGNPQKPCPRLRRAASPSGCFYWRAPALTS